MRCVGVVCWDRLLDFYCRMRERSRRAQQRARVREKPIYGGQTEVAMDCLLFLHATATKLLQNTIVESGIDISARCKRSWIKRQVKKRRERSVTECDSTRQKCWHRSFASKVNRTSRRKWWASSFWTTKFVLHESLEALLLTTKNFLLRSPCLWCISCSCQPRESKEQTPYSCVYAVICKVAHAQ